MGGGNAILVRQFRSANAASAFVSNVSYLLWRQPSLGQSFIHGHTALVNHVKDVRLSSSQEEMIRSHAQWIVAAVQHVKGLVERTVVHVVRYAMRFQRSTAAPTRLNLTVSSACLRTYPQPASIGLLHVARETFSQADCLSH